MDVESSYNVSRTNFVDTGVNGVAIHRGKLRLALIRQHGLRLATRSTRGRPCQFNPLAGGSTERQAFSSGVMN